MSSVFLSNVDDYLGPSQACVNPLFGGSEKAQEEDPKVKKRRRRVVVGNSPAPVEPVKASIADCLACSGCVTTAETVLLEQEHSWRQWTDEWNDIPVVVTISPASAAALRRQSGNLPSFFQRLATVMHKYLNVQVVLDGSIPLAWSRHEAAVEFCEKYRQRQQQQQQPLVSSSCPATVCWVEKSVHAAVPFLTHTRSPMGAAGVYWKRHLRQTYRHVAVMPCHDKKLEASRDRDENKLTHLVVTTQECWDILKEVCNCKTDEELKALLQSQEKSCDFESMSSWKASNETVPTSIGFLSEDSMEVDTDEKPTSTLIVDSSGGYADSVFRYAAKNLFGVDIEHLIWQPVPSNQKGPVSARVAQRRCEFWQACLYKRADESFIMQGDEAAVPVLHFCIANGLQTLQRAMSSFMDEKKTNMRFDYIEAMACPSGCLNGGGQMRVNARETPTETRHRLSDTHAHFHTSAHNEVLLDRVDMTVPPFQIVAPLQHAIGATAGVAVEDTQW